LINQNEKGRTKNCGETRVGPKEFQSDWRMVV
jgi:hypothetical protein